MYNIVKLIFGFWFLRISSVQSQATNLETSTISPFTVSTYSMFSVTSADTTSITSITKTETSSSMTITSPSSITTLNLNTLPSDSTLTTKNLPSSSPELTTHFFSGQSSSDITTKSLTSPVTGTSPSIAQSNFIFTSETLTSSSSELKTQTFSIASSNFVTSSSVQSSSDLITISTSLMYSSTDSKASSTKMSDITTSILPTSMLPSSTVNFIGSASQGLSSSGLNTTSYISPTQEISSTTTLTATTLSTDQITSPYWVLTVCNISTLTDLTTSTFKTDKELRLSNAYAVALSIQTSGRRKRAATNGTNTLQIVSVTRIIAMQTPTNLVYYIVGSGNSYISPSTVINNMNRLTAQQMSILLDAPVTTVATYYNSATQSPGTDQKLWIIGAVFGSLAGVALIIWLVFFIYSRCLRPWDEPLILKESMDLERNDSFSDDQIKKVISLNSEEHLNERMNSKLEKSYKEISKESTENRQAGNEIVIKHVYESRPRKYHKRHSSSSSSSSDDKKKNKSSKETKIKLDSSSNDTNVKNVKKKEKKKSKIKQKSIKDKNEPQISEEIIVSSAFEMQMMASNITLNTNLSKDDHSDLTPVDEKFVEILKYQDQLTNINDDRSIESDQHLQSPKSTDNKINVNLIEVLPKIVPQNDTSSYELVEPVPFVDNYEHLHIFPNYSTEIYTISDTSLSLVEIKETDKLESQRSEMKSNKNLRTIEPLPRKNVHKINYDISTDDLIASLKKEINEIKQNNTKTD